ncbi:ABC transporter permease [Streptomyces boninensis]|uniref:ABC transporter permease n=1 Tax=Streptomyces boninensis TaxID=2039455 RepID=UPI003B210370
MSAASGIRPAPRRPYAAVYLSALQEAMAYRRAVLVDLASNVVWATVLFYLWRSIFAGSAQIGGYTWDEMRTYVLVSYALGQILSFRVEMQMHKDVRTGQVALDLVRPLGYPAMQLVRAFGAATLETAGALAGAAVIGAAVLHVLPPVSLAGAVLFVFAAAAGIAVNALICFLTSLLCFWTESAYGLILARQAITNFLAGAMVPLALFPGPLRALTEWLPFSAVVSTPAQLYLGKLAGADAFLALARQAAWVGALVLLTAVLWRGARRRLTVNGG